MSIADLLTPLSVGKTYMDINVNGINVGPGGSSMQGPLIIEGNTRILNKPLIGLIEDDQTPAVIDHGLVYTNHDNTASVSLIVSNNPGANAGISADGINGLLITSINPASVITLSIAGNPAMGVGLVSPGVTSTFIQNLTFPTVGGAPSTLNYYEEFGPLLMAFSGPWGAAYARAINITRSGNTVTMRIDACEQVPTAPVESDITTSGNVIPPRFLPAAAADETALVYITIPVFDQNSSRLGTLRINPAGTITITSSQAANPVFAPFANNMGGTKVGFPNLFVSYFV